MEIHDKEVQRPRTQTQKRKIGQLVDSTTQTL